MKVKPRSVWCQPDGFKFWWQRFNVHNSWPFLALFSLLELSLVYIFLTKFFVVYFCFQPKQKKKAKHFQNRINKVCFSLKNERFICSPPRIEWKFLNKIYLIIVLFTSVTFRLKLETLVLQIFFLYSFGWKESISFGL